MVVRGGNVSRVIDRGANPGSDFKLRHKVLTSASGRSQHLAQQLHRIAATFLWTF